MLARIHPKLLSWLSGTRNVISPTKLVGCSSVAEDKADTERVMSIERVFMSIWPTTTLRPDSECFRMDTPNPFTANEPKG